MANTNYILNGLFTQKVFRELLDYGENHTYSTAVNQYAKGAETNYDAIKAIYKTLAQEHRNEYFYLNTLLNKWLVGIHSVKSTTALTQVPINNSIADFILMNGISVVYEIKSDLDNFERLNSQILDYYTAFSRVCVVVPEVNFGKACTLLKNTSVGIYSLTKNITISRKNRKEPIENNSLLNHTSIFKVLNKKEYENILIKQVGELPKVKPVFYYDECLKAFCDIPIDCAYSLFIEELKKRNNISKYTLDAIPDELKALFYFFNPAYRNVDGLHDFLSKRLEG